MQCNPNSRDQPGSAGNRPGATAPPAADLGIPNVPAAVTSKMGPVAFRVPHPLPRTLPKRDRFPVLHVIGERNPILDADSNQLPLQRSRGPGRGIVAPCLRGRSIRSSGFFGSHTALRVILLAPALRSTPGSEGNQEPASRHTGARWRWDPGSYPQVSGEQRAATEMRRVQQKGRGAGVILGVM